MCINCQLICHRIKKKAKQILIKRIGFRTNCLFRKSDVERKLYGKYCDSKSSFFLETIRFPYVWRLTLEIFNILETVYYIGCFLDNEDNLVAWILLKQEEKKRHMSLLWLRKFQLQLHLFIYFWSAYLKSKHGFSRLRKENHICPAIFGQCNDYQWRGESYKFYFHILSSTVLLLLQTRLRWSLSKHLYAFYFKLCCILNIK